MVVALDPSKRSEQCSPVHPLLIGMIHLQERHILGLHGQPRLRLALCVLGRPSSTRARRVARAAPHLISALFRRLAADVESGAADAGFSLGGRVMIFTASICGSSFDLN